MERVRGLRVSSAQWFFWALFFITSVPTSYIQIRDLIYSDDPDIFPAVTCLVSIALIVFSLFLHFFVDAKPTYEGPGKQEVVAGKPCPSSFASFPSTLTFAWFTSLAWTGFKRTLATEDLWELPPEVSCKVVVPRFNKHWDQIRANAAIKQAEINAKKKLEAANAAPDVSFKKDGEDVKVVDGSAEKKETEDDKKKKKEATEGQVLVKLTYAAS